jgi:hypothetical protein
MSAKDASLYGAPRPKKQKTGNEISSSTSLAFSSHLSSLIASSTSKATSTSSTTSGRAKPKKNSIFNAHNKGAAARARADLSTSSPAFEQKHSTHGEGVDSAEWRRAQRRMEEKARKYADMKAGYLDDKDDKHLIDFDRKWAERQQRNEDSDSEQSSHSSHEDHADDNDIVEYVDELGRTRTGTRAAAAREERRRKRAEEAQNEDPDRFTARPVEPSNILYGDTIQSSAFNPDEPIAAQMAHLAAKRDKKPTPPPDTHFDSRKEVRTKGTAFFQFSADEEERREQMDNLEKERKETERQRAERDARMEKRKKEVQERRKEIAKRRGRKQADAFLDHLGEELFASHEEKPLDPGHDE